ncbi:MAG: glycerophosphodiester phosphodiesterase [Pseudomonas sp.]
MASIADGLNSLANHLWTLAPRSRKPADCTEVGLVAHRGAHGQGPNGLVLENTLEAFDLCLQLGVWGAEMDIHLTRDGEPVIHHDAHCGRLFNRPDIIIAETTFRDLRVAVPQIPHLDEVLQLNAGRMHLMLEIKESWRQRSVLPQRVTPWLKSLTPGEDYHLLSLVPDHLEGFSDIPRSAFVDVAQANTGTILKQSRALGHGAMAGSFALMGADCLRQLREEGQQIGTGLVENRMVLNREVHRGVDWVFTDRILTLQPDPTDLPE